MMKTADCGNPFFFLFFFECSGLREPVKWRKMGEGWGRQRREKEEEEEGGRASSALVEGVKPRHCWRRESSEDAQLNWEFCCESSAAVSCTLCTVTLPAEAPSTPSTRSLLRCLSKLQP